MIYNTLHEITLAQKFLHQGTIAKELGKFQEPKHTKNTTQRYNSKLYAENNGT